MKRFYWALSKDFEFGTMPELNDQHKDAINREASIFEGNPKKKIVVVKKEGEGMINIIKYNCRRGSCT